MARQRTKTGGNGVIALGLFRECWMSDDRVEITAPLIFGPAILFDRTLKVVTIRATLFHMTFSKKEIPFSDVTIGMGARPEKGGIDPRGIYVPDRTRYFVEMKVGHRDALRLHEEFNASRQLRRIFNAIRKLGIAVTHPQNYE